MQHLNFENMMVELFIKIIIKVCLYFQTTFLEWIRYISRTQYYYCIQMVRTYENIILKILSRLCINT